MVSYVDVLTILLIFFIAVAARLPANRRELPRVEAPVPVPAAVVAPVRSPLANAQAALGRHGIDARMEARGLVISLPQAILFASGDDRIADNALPMVEQIASVILDLPNRVSLIGHADSVPIHNRRFRNNWELSAARGVSLLEMLSRRNGVPEARLSVESESANRPRNSNETAEGRAENRRVEIVILADEAPGQ
jgi:flagellar motor protein MotB